MFRIIIRQLKIKQKKNTARLQVCMQNWSHQTNLFPISDRQWSRGIQLILWLNFRKPPMRPCKGDGENMTECQQGWMEA